MAVIYKCDLCDKEVNSENGENPLVTVDFEVAQGAWECEICPDCERMLYYEVVKAKYEFWKKMSEKPKRENQD